MSLYGESPTARPELSQGEIYMLRAALKRAGQKADNRASLLFNPPKRKETSSRVVFSSGAGASQSREFDDELPATYRDHWMVDATIAMTLCVLTLMFLVFCLEPIANAGADLLDWFYGGRP